MLIALARKLAISLWRYVETGLVPDGAVMCSAAIWMRPATVRMGIWHRGNGMIVAA